MRKTRIYFAIHPVTVTCCIKRLYHILIMQSLPGVIPKTSREFYIGGQEYIRRFIPLILTLNSHKNSHENSNVARKSVYMLEIPRLVKYGVTVSGNPCQWYQKETFDILPWDSRLVVWTAQKIHNSLLSGVSSSLHYSSFSRGDRERSSEWDVDVCFSTCGVDTGSGGPEDDPAV